MLDRQIAATLISLRRAWKAPAGARQPPAPTLDADDAFAHATAAIVITDARLRVVAANPAYAALTGQALSACIGQPLPGVHPDALDGQPREVRCGQGEGVTRTAWMQLSTVTDAQGAVLGHVATLADISALEHERRVLRQLFMDLDRFKWVNDNLGHEAGDTMLQEVARRLRSTVRAEDLVGRWGGDEFIVVLDAPADAAAALRTAALLQAAIERQVEFAGHGVSLSASIGVAMYPDDADGQAGLIRGADAAMYRAKHEGRGRTVLVRPA
jgi:diguanylate cyclase (GGDEF)-like protein